MNEILKEFILFITEKNIFFNIIITVIATLVLELCQSFSKNILSPIIDRDGDKDGIPDINKLKNKTKKIFGITFKYGEFLSTLIKFIILLLIIFFMSYSLKKTNLYPGYKISNILKP